MSARSRSRHSRPGRWRWCRRYSPGIPCPRNGSGPASRGRSAGPREPEGASIASSAFILWRGVEFTPRLVKLAGWIGAHDLVRSGVALGDEPERGGHMAPPLANDAGFVFLQEDIVGPGGDVRGIRIGHILDLATPDELRGVARSVQRAVDDLHVSLGLAQWPTDAAPFSPTSEKSAKRDKRK